MKEDVSVRVCGVQRCPGAEEDVSELVCHTIFYEFPLGRLTMELHTDSVCASFDGACGTLELCYRLTVRDETVSENRLTVTLAPR